MMSSGFFRRRIDDATDDIFAVYEKNKNRPLTVGKLRVVSYAVQHHTVTLVPVGVEAPDAGELQRKLNAIYAPYGVEFTVKVDGVIKELPGWKGRTFKLEGNGFFTRENADMAEVRKAYQAVQSTPKGSYYVFVLGRADASSEDGATQANGAQGDMPRGQQFGYVFGDGVQDWSWLLAHELGHGVFTLQHLEDGNYGTKGTLGSIANLMNYTRSTELQAFQWNIMSNPAILTALDSDDASKAVESGSSEIVALFAKLTKQYGDGVYVAFHGFTCDAPKNKTFDISASRINDFEVLAAKTVQTSPSTGLMAMYFRSTTTESGKLVEEAHGLVDYNGLVKQIKSQVGKAENYLHFYTYKQGNFIPLKKKNDEYSELKDEACQLMGTTSSEHLSTYCTHILSKIIAIKAKNAILFVNGYDITKPITTNEVFAYDAINYWEGIDMLFKDRRKANTCFYANGNMSISTSNHQNAAQFGLSLSSMNSLYPIISVH